MILRPELLSQVAFVDFEASSLEPGGWPIEVGISTLEAGAVTSWSSLIRPHTEWDMDAWSVQSAAVHRIDRNLLDIAPAARDVADELIARMKGRLVLSDAPEHDQKWLNLLLEASSQHAAILLKDFDNASFSAFDGLDLDRLFEALERRKAPHRAGPDSARLAYAWATAFLSASR